MSSPARPRFGQRRPGARAARSVRQGSDINQTLMALLPEFARMASSGAIQPVTSRPNVPASAAPEKCRLEMSAGEFRAWKNSVDWWLKLNNWKKI